MGNDMYERFSYRGVTLDRQTIAALHVAEHEFGKAIPLIQGSYNAGGVSASGGTHDGGGAIDMQWTRRIKKQNRAMRNACFAGWPRPLLPGEWNAHYHAELLGNNNASNAARAQWASYRNGRNGLADGGQDRYPYRPTPVRDFDYQREDLVSWKRLNKVAGSRTRTAWTRSGRREVEVVARALRGFGMDLSFGGKVHRRGRMDDALVDAVRRFARIRHVGDTLVGPLGPQVMWELCIPTRET